MTLRYAVIADIVGSRTLTNRADAQRIFEAALERASEGLALLQAPYPTVGDEFQAVAYTLEDALLLTLRAQLLLPSQLQLRFGRASPGSGPWSRCGLSGSSGRISVVGGPGRDQPRARCAGCLEPLYSHVVHGARVRRI